VVEWIEGEAAWQIIDQLATKYTGAPYPREQERVVAVIEPERQTVGIGCDPPVMLPQIGTGLLPESLISG
jgi:hypothetical protein